MRNKIRNLDILGDDKRNGSYHWYAIDIDNREATGETCCSITQKGAWCEGFKTEQLAKQAGYNWNKTRRRKSKNQNDRP